MPQALLFIPDISGYTQFVTRTEINHQQHIITELLDILIESNTIGLELAEVEGDALFYYKVNNIPSGDEILKLIRKMFLRFHTHLTHYEHNRICHCGACEGATGLNLKFVVHKGDISFLKLKGQKSKPLGKEVITVHRLLKNNINSDEYILITDAVNDISKEKILLTLETNEVNQAIQDYGSTDVGKIQMTYADLHPLRKYILNPEAYAEGFKSTKPITVEKEVDLKAMDLFEVMINFEHRLNWSEGLDDLTYNSREMNKAGTKHICIIADKKVHVDTIKAQYGKDKWVFGERSDAPFVGELYVYNIITPIENKSLVRIEAHPNPSSISGKLLMPLFKWKFKSILSNSIQKLKDYVESPEVIDYFDSSMLHAIAE